MYSLEKWSFKSNDFKLLVRKQINLDIFSQF